MGVDFPFGDVLEFGREHLAPDGGGMVREQVSVQMGELVLDHAAGKVVKGLKKVKKHL